MSGARERRAIVPAPCEFRSGCGLISTLDGDLDDGVESIASDDDGVRMRERRRRPKSVPAQYFDIRAERAQKDHVANVDAESFIPSEIRNMNIHPPRPNTFGAFLDPTTFSLRRQPWPSHAHCSRASSQQRWNTSPPTHRKWTSCHSSLSTECDYSA